MTRPVSPTSEDIRQVVCKSDRSVYTWWSKVSVTPHTVDLLGAKKARGAFYTPPGIARFLADWAIRSSSDAVLEPSCGEAAFLISSYERLRSLTLLPPPAEQLVGLDIHAGAVTQAAAQLASIGGEAALEVGDFLAFRADRRFDVVVGNPPYVRYQSFTGQARAKAQEAALAQGVRLGGLASSWAAFVVHAASFLKPDGRLALVLPAELLTVNYAAPVRRYLMQRFGHVRLVLFEERVFPGVLEEVVLLLAEGQGPTNQCELVQARNVVALPGLTPQAWTPTDAEDKWIAGLLPADSADLYARMLDTGSFEPLQRWGETNLGMVTGNNSYFVLSASKVRDLELCQRELLPICPPGSRHLRGLNFTERAWQEMADEGSSSFLFYPTSENLSPSAKAYIKHGEVEGVHQAYKCRVRSPWWKVPRVAAPDAFLTYMNHDTPRLVTNRAGVHHLNSIHGMTFNTDCRQLAMDLLPLAVLNSVTLLGSELVGRSYGGGMLKLEPREADLLPVPSRALVN
ncbi:MAG: N-6 DNA methylase, partial [Acidobacteria bacterium]|nr:N-6 DNA methylase [Acidobacteriota bacterium]